MQSCFLYELSTTQVRFKFKSPFCVRKILHFLRDGGLQFRPKSSFEKTNKLVYRPAIAAKSSFLKPSFWPYAASLIEMLSSAYPIYACGSISQAPCLKPKLQVLNQKPIFTGFNFVLIHFSYKRSITILQNRITTQTGLIPIVICCALVPT